MCFLGFFFFHVTIKNSKHMVTDTKDMKRAQRNHELNLATKMRSSHKSNCSVEKCLRFAITGTVSTKLFLNFSVLVLLGVINEH